jgi:isoamylase
VPGEDAYNFALYSKHAERVTLLLYGEDDLVRPLLAEPLDPLLHKTGRIWHCRIPTTALSGARFYAYAVEGPPPAGPFEWHAFDPEKVLLDPYARAVHFPAAFDRHAAMTAGSNAGRAPLGVLRAGEASREWPDSSPARHESDAIIYELHVRGFTRSPTSGLPAEDRGTYRGLTARIPYLQHLGVTAVELMPVFQYDPQEGNYWGYMPMSFFAPHRAYARDADAEAPLREFHAMVTALHRAGIEVILDVVYNHTAEGDESGPTYSFRGIDNSTYYLMTADPAHPYADLSGAGNTVHTANRYVRKLIVDSLRYWAREMHVDGFRFDLAAAFSRDPAGGTIGEDSGLFGDIAADPELSRLRLIAEPWDAAGAFQLGRSLPGITWSQWNSRFRDDLRRFARGDAGLVPSLMRRLYGSDDLFPDDADTVYHPYQSVNYITCHDGFTLYDLVAYNTKVNWANGHQNQDGPAQEFSWNCGWEGDVGAPDDVVELRSRQARNFCALLLLSNGIPMLRAGDEFLQTQGGNSNAYNQDNETSWLDWSRLETHADVFRFFRGMIQFRKAHPTLCRARFWRQDVHWHGTTGGPDLSVDSRTIAFYLDGAAEGDDDLYVMINGGPAPAPFLLQEGAREQWLRVVDTGRAAPDDLREPGDEAALESARYSVAPHSVVVLTRPRAGVAGGTTPA